MRALSSAGEAMTGGGGGGFTGSSAGAAWTESAARQVSAKNGRRFMMDTSDAFNILPPMRLDAISGGFLPSGFHVLSGPHKISMPQVVSCGTVMRIQSLCRSGTISAEGASGACHTARDTAPQRLGWRKVIVIGR